MEGLDSDLSEALITGRFNAFFANLRKYQPDIPGPVAEPVPVDEPREYKPACPQSVRQRAVVRLERKGHGGKTVSRISEMAHSEEDAAECSTYLRKQLGCGGTTEGTDILLQGDQRTQLESMLFALGVKRVVFG